MLYQARNSYEAGSLDDSMAALKRAGLGTSRSPRHQQAVELPSLEFNGIL
jgi:hypothetical protein